MPTISAGPTAVDPTAETTTGATMIGPAGTKYPPELIR